MKLVPLAADGVEFLYRLAIDEEIGWRWRFAGSVPRRDQFEQTLWAGVLTQFLVTDTLQGGLIGSAIAYNADLNHGYTFVAVGMVPEATGTGLGIEATDLFVGHLFGCYSLRKVYFEVPEYNLAQFESSLGWLLKEEGMLKNHTFYNGRYWDRAMLALYRDDYEALSPRGRALGRRRR